MLSKWVLKLPWDVLSIVSEKHGLEPELVAALAFSESAGNRYAIRYEPNWKYLYKPEVFAKDLGITLDSEIQAQKFSYGYMQVMGSVARELGHNGSLMLLCEPFTAFEYGCAKLAECFKRFNKIDLAVAAYNAGTPRTGADGKLSNQGYVDRVMGYYQNLSR